MWQEQNAEQWSQQGAKAVWWVVSGKVKRDNCPWLWPGGAAVVWWWAEECMGSKPVETWEMKKPRWRVWWGEVYDSWRRHRINCWFPFR